MGPSEEPGKVLDPPASCAGPGAGAGANIDSLATVVGGAISGGICCDPVALWNSWEKENRESSSRSSELFYQFWTREEAKKETIEELLPGHRGCSDVDNLQIGKSTINQDSRPRRIKFLKEVKTQFKLDGTKSKDGYVRLMRKVELEKCFPRHFPPKSGRNAWFCTTFSTIFPCFLTIFLTSFSTRYPLLSLHISLVPSLPTKQ